MATLVPVGARVKVPGVAGEDVVIKCAEVGDGVVVVVGFPVSQSGEVELMEVADTDDGLAMVAGSRRVSSTAMMAVMTRSSTRVKAGGLSRPSGVCNGRYVGV